MNNDLISRSALLENIEKSRKAHASVRSRLTVGDMEQMIKGARAVDAEVVRHGRWRPYKQNVECSECYVKWAVDESIAVVYTSIKDLKYCPNCGAKMDAEVEG